MNPPTTSKFKYVALAASIFTFGLVVVGGIVRVTGSGLGCPDWPLCHGQLIPPFDGPTLIEYSHRMFATLTSVFVVAAAGIAAMRHRKEKWLFFPAVLALVLLGVQIVLGGVTVLMELPPVIVAVHLANALMIFACLILVTIYSFRPIMNTHAPGTAEARYRRLVWGSAIGTLALVISGAVVTGTSAFYTCATWPLCNDQLIPAQLLPQIAMAHRVVAAAIGLLIIYTFAETWRLRVHASELKTTSVIAALLFLAQIVVSVVMVQTKFEIVWRLVHLAASTALWGAMVVLLILAYQMTWSPRGEPGVQASAKKTGAAIA